jgi:3-hydroxypropanoate dehydrogenase
MANRLGQDALNQLFLEARTQNKWQAKDVPDTTLHELVNLMNMGPTSANCEPTRIIFVRTPAAKQRLAPFLSEGNRSKTMDAPVCAILAYDLKFYEHLVRGQGRCHDNDGVP